MAEKKEIVLDKRYYESLMKEYKYNPLEFENINFFILKLNPPQYHIKITK